MIRPHHAIVIFLYFLTSNIHAQTQLIDSLLKNKRHYTATRLEENQSPRIDGLLNDKCWQLGNWSGDFIQRQPFGGKLSTEKTRIKVLYDYANLYVGILCIDRQPDLIRNIFDERDNFTGDYTGIAIDSYFDKRTAFEFGLTAAGQKLDHKHLGDFELDKNWNAVWRGKTTLNDSSWIAEMQIPFSQLRYTRKENYVMGVHFTRIISRISELSNWDYTPKTASARVFLFGELDGIHNIRSSRQVEILPYISSSVQHKSTKNSFDALTLNGGIDAKIGISSNYTLDLTVNPDFGQVEADPSVLNLTSYETFYQEKRPFFLEGNEVFDFSIDGNSIYYSRRIGSPPSFPGSYKSLDITNIPSASTILTSAKLIGKNSKGLSVGALNSITLGEYARATTDGDGISWRIPVSPLTNYFSARIKKELNEGQTVFGGAVSSVNRFFNDTITPELVPGSSSAAGLDFTHYWNKRTYYFQAKAAGSHISGDAKAILEKQLAHNHRFQRPDATHLEVDSSATHLDGHGALLGFGKKGGNLKFEVIGQYRTPGLNLNEMGYMTDADIVSETSSISYEMNNPKKRILNYTVGLTHKAGWTFGRENTINNTALSYTSRFKNLWGIDCRYIVNYSVLDTKALWGGPALRMNLNQNFSFSVNTNTSRDLSASAKLNYGATNDKVGKSSGLEGTINWLPVNRIKLSLSASYNRSKNNQQYIKTISLNNTKDYLTGLIDRKIVNMVFRSDIYVTPELSFRYYGSPYFSTGRYSDFKKVANAGSYSIESRFDKLDVIYDQDNSTYSYNLDGTGVTFGDPDFSFLQFRSSFVFRWEYKLGSTLYFVWSNGKTVWQDRQYDLGSLAGDLFNSPGDNAFMVKLSYWFSL